MSEASMASSVYRQAKTQRNFTMFAFIVVAVPTAFVFQAQVARGEFASLDLLGTEFVSLSPTVGAVGAFLVTEFGNLALLSAGQHR